MYDYESKAGQHYASQYLQVTVFIREWNISAAIFFVFNSYIKRHDIDIIAFNG